MTVMRRGKALKLQKFMRQNNPTAFMFITNTSEIIGRGFREFSCCESWQFITLISSY